MRLITLSAITGAEAMFDGYVETQTEAPEELVTTFGVGGKNCVAIFNDYGLTATLEVGGETLTVSLIRDSIKDWWDYFFAPSRIGRDVVFYFPTQTGDATLTIAYPGGTAKCGLCVTGVAREIGSTEWGAEVGITDYSKISVDGFGQTYLAAGQFARRAQCEIIITREQYDIAYREIVKNRGLPTLFDFNMPAAPLTEYHTSEHGFQSLLIYGFCEAFSPPIEYGVSRGTIEAKGLT